MTSSSAPAIPVNALFPAPGTVFTSKLDLQPADAIEDASDIEDSAGALRDSSGRVLDVKWKFEYVSTEWLARQAEVKIQKRRYDYKRAALESDFEDDDNRNLIDSIVAEGFWLPIILYGNILEGYHRLLAALYIGLPIVPVIYAIPPETGERIEEAILWPRRTPVPTANDICGPVAA
jgi:hypothetical protein